MIEEKIQQKEEKGFSFKRLFVPLTTFKVVHIIAVVAVVVFGNMLLNGFVWDDIQYIIQNQDFSSFRIAKIFGPSIFNDSSFYRPMPAFYFNLMHVLFNDISFFYHFSQLALHVVNASLLFILFKKCFDNHVALLLSLIFLIHPIQVESVSFISQTVNPLLFIFGITAFLLSQKEHLSIRRKLTIFGLLLLSFLSKETGVLFLIITVLGRIIFKKPEGYMFVLYGLITSIFYFLIRFGIGKVYFVNPITIVPIRDLHFLERAINIPAIIFYYLKTFFFPLDLAIDQLWIIKTVNFSTFYLPFLIDICFFILLIVFGVHLFRTNKKSFRLFLFFSLWFLMGLFMHLQIFPLNMTVADRWFYFPLGGLLGTLGIIAKTISEIVKNRTNDFLYRKILMVSYATSIVLLILLSARTVVRNINWADAITLYSHDSKIHDNFDIENLLGNEYLTKGNISEAQKHLQRSVDLLPNGINLYNLGTAYEQKNDLSKAGQLYAQSIKNAQHLSSQNNVTLPYLSYSYISLTRVLLFSGNDQEAKKVAKAGIKQTPNFGYLWALLGAIEYKLDNYEEALTAANKARELTSDDLTNYIYSQILNKQPVELKGYNNNFVISP